MGHGYENTSIAEIRQILRDQYNVDEEILKQTKKPLVELLLAYNENAAKIKKESRADEEEIDSPILVESLQDITLKDLGELMGMDMNNDNNNTEEEENVGENEDGELTTLDNTDLPSFNDLEIDVQDDGLVSIPEFEDNILPQFPHPIVEEIVQEVEQKQIFEVPRMFDEGWTDYVLSLLREKEIYNGYPKCSGLRRLVQILIGPITSKQIRYHPSNIDNNTTISVLVTCRVDNQKHPAKNTSIIEESIADANPDNNKDYPYSTHMSPIAERRAESRVYRNLLNLDVVSAEEMAGTQIEGQNFSMNDIDNNITQIQIMALDLIGKRNNINIMDYINAGKEKGYKSIDEVPRDVAVKMIEVMNKISAGEIEKPESIGDYDSTWMSK